MKTVYLVMVPQKDPKSQPKIIVTDDLSKLVGRYQNFNVQLVEFI